MITITNLNDIKKIIFDKDFNNHVILINFYANWCTSCNILQPELEKLENIYANRLLIINVDIEKGVDIEKAFTIEAVPTSLFYFKNRLFKELTIVGGTIGMYYQNVNILLSQYNV